MGPPSQQARSGGVAQQLNNSNAGEEQNNDLAQQVQYFVNKRIEDSTRASYLYQMRKYATWLKQNYPNIHNSIGEAGPLDVDLHSIPSDALPKFLADYRTKNKSKGNTLSNIVSGVKSYYNDKRIEFPKDLANHISMVITDVKKLTQKQRRAGIIDATEGKNPLNFTGYRYLCDTFYKEQMDKWGCYTILTWNLMCRTDNTQHIVFNRMKWEDDCLAILFSSVKTDHAGEREANYKHIYANPFMPEVCPILSLGVYLLSTPGLTSKLFAGSNCAHSYSQCLYKLKYKYSGELSSLGLHLNKIGVHSLRKGAATYASCGVTEGPSHASVSLRCDWSLGSVQSRYIRYEKAGDYFVGRTVAGLPVGTADFSILPPHFEHARLEEDNIDWLKSTHGEIPKVLAECFGSILEKYPTMIKVVEMGLASVLYHKEFLRKHLKPNHALFASPLFTHHYVDTLEKYVVCKHKSTRFTATGIPGTVTLHSALAQMKTMMKLILEEVRKPPDHPLGVTNTSGVGTNSTTSNQLDEIHNMLSTIHERVHTNPTVVTSTSEVGEVTEDAVDPNIFKIHQHSPDEYFAIPQGWSFPRVSLENGWKLWWKGIPANRIKPFRSFVPRRDLPTGCIRKRYGEWKSVFTEFERILLEDYKLVAKPNAKDLDDMFQYAYVKFIDEFGDKNKKRNHELMISTHARKIGEIKGKRRKLSSE